MLPWEPLRAEGSPESHHDAGGEHGEMTWAAARLRIIKGCSNAGGSREDQDMQLLMLQLMSVPVPVLLDPVCVQERECVCVCWGGGGLGVV